MNRGSAERAVAESSLSMAEKLTMMMLLRRADNDTCIVPDWRTPAQSQLAAEVTISTRWLRILVAHLELHGWMKVTRGRGRGHKTGYALVPGADPGKCDCANKRGTGVPLSRVTKGGTGRHLLKPEKGNWGSAEKRNSNGATPQVSLGFAPRAHQGKRVVQGQPPPESSSLKGELCIGPDCCKPARRGCRTCWDHARLELAGAS